MFGPTRLPVDSGSFSPGQLANLLSWHLDGDGYDTATLQGLPILKCKEPGTLAIPRGCRCYNFDGTNDYGVNTVFNSVSTTMTWCCWIKPAAVAGTRPIMSNRAAGGHLFLGLESQKIYGYHGTNYLTLQTADLITTSAFHHVALVLDGTAANIYHNGVLAATRTITTDIGSGGQLSLGFDAGLWAYYSGKMYDVRVYNAAKNTAQIAAIYNQSLDRAALDTVGLIAHWPCQEESGATAYDASGNGNHLTLTNITQSTFHAVDSGVKWSAANSLGHSRHIVVSPTNPGTWASTWRGDQGAAGDCFAEFEIANISSGHMVGLTTRDSVTTYSHIDVGLYINGGSGATYYENGSSNGILTAAFAIGDRVRISRSGTTVNVVVNGVQVGSFPTALSGRVYPAVAMYASTPAIVTGFYDNNFVSLTGKGNESTQTERVIPIDIATPTLDASDGELQYGPLKMPATTEVPCITLDPSVNVGIEFSDISAHFTTEASIAIRIKPVLATSFSNTLGTSYDSNWYPFNDSGAYLSFFRANRVGPAYMVNVSTWHWLIVTTKPGAGGYNIYQDLTKIGTAAGESTVVMSGTAYPGVKPQIVSQVGTCSVGEIYIWNRELTTGEMQSLVDDNAVPESGLIVAMPNQDGPGTSNTNRELHDASGNGYHGSLLNGSVVNIWANRCPYAQDWSISHGGSHNPNLLSYSGDYTNAYWAQNSVTAALNSLGPNGANELSTLTESAGTGVRSLYRSAITVEAGGTYCYSVYLRAGTRRFVLVSVDNGAIGNSVIVDTQNWTLFSISSATLVDSGIESAGGGLYRVWVSGIVGTSTALNCVIYANGTSNTVDVNVVSTGQTLIAGAAQFERGASPTPYQANATNPNGAFIPGRMGSNLDAAGNSKTLAAGKHGNPNSRRVPNYWGAPALSLIGETASTKYAPSDDVQAIAPNDTKHSRRGTKGTDRCFTVSQSLSGSTLASANRYTGA